MTGDNPFADDDDDLDRTVVRPAAGPAPAAAAPAGGVGAGAPAPAGPPPTAGAGAPPPPPGRDPPPAPAARFSLLPRQGRAAASAAPPARPVGSGPLSGPGTCPLGDPALIRDPALLIGASSSRLLDAAAPLLALIVTARDMESHPDPEALLEGAIVEVRAFETAALATGHSSEQIRLARYALCATMDDVVLATPWGGQTAWASRGLVTTIHRETMSGERFFTLLDTLMAKPAENHDVLQVFYVCLSLGFEGRYRVMPRGAIEISRARDRLYRTLTRDSDPPTGPLSPAGRAAVAPQGPVPGGVLPIWVPVALGLAALVGIYALMARDLDGASASVVAIEQRFAQPVVRAGVDLPAPRIEVAPPPEPAPVAAAPDPSPALPDRIRQRLAADLAAGRVEVLELPVGVAVRIVAPDIFPSGSATATADLQALTRRIAAALDPEAGEIAILGHTDSIAMRANARFADNTALSLARAQAVAEVLRPALARAERVVVRGLGPDVPIADNATAQGRALNRRVEALLIAEGITTAQAIEGMAAATGWRTGP